MVSNFLAQEILCSKRNVPKIKDTKRYERFCGRLAGIRSRGLKKC